MKRSSKSFTTGVAASSVALVLAWPAVALADAYTDDPAGRGILASFCGIYACLGVFGLLALVFWVWMLVDVIARQEHEFPGSTGNSKTMWLLIMLLTLPMGCSWIAAIVYYFVVYQKIRRGTVPPPQPAQWPPQPAGSQAPMPPAPPAPPAAPPIAPPPAAPQDAPQDAPPPHD